MNKIWGVGLSRTGTRSLHEALGLLGFRSVHNPPPEEMYDGDFSSLKRVDAALDIPIALWFRELDQAFPNSRFILTVREPEEWVESLCRHLNANPAATRPERARRMRVAVYGSVHPARDELLRVYHDHHREVTTYFADRPDDFLILNICKGQGWEVLCSFLQKNAPAQPFPHQHRMNKSTRKQIEPRKALPQSSTDCSTH